MFDDVLSHRKHLLLLVLLNVFRIQHLLPAPSVQAGLFRPLYQVELRLGDAKSDTVLLILEVVQLSLLLHPRRGEALLLLLKPRQLLLLPLTFRQEVQLEAVALAQLTGRERW